MVINVDLIQAIFRTIFFYFLIVLAYRIMGKREVGQLGVIDLIVSILMAELIAISIENIEDPIYLTIIPIFILVVLEVGLAFVSVKSKKFRNVMGGKPSLIIFNGKINFKELIKQRYTLDDLLLALRQQSIKNLSDVEYAFLENNGKLSIFKYNFLKLKSDYPMPVIIDGSLQKETLTNINKNEVWLKYNLKRKKIKLEEVFYAFYKNKKLYIIKRNC